MRTFILMALLAPLFAMAADPEQGARLYENYCVQCHGKSADGKGINASAMSVMPRDHSNYQEMSGRSDEELFGVIRNGGKSINQSILMPAWAGNLSDDQIWSLVRHLRLLCCNSENEG